MEEVLTLTQQDLGNRGIKHLIDDRSINDYKLACQELLNSTSVGIITGSFVHQIACETDGPLGAFSIAKTLLHLKKKVVFIVDSSNRQIIEDFLKSSTITAICPIYTFSCDLNPISGENVEKLSTTILDENEIDCIVSIERFGRTENGKYYSMRAMDLSNSCGNIDFLFELAKEKKIKTISVGDGGNEIGMGKVHEKVKKFIKNGETIACSVSADLLIVVGVSNWGGLAISAGIFLLMKQEKKVDLNDCLSTIEEEYQLLKDLVKFGAIDGISGKAELTVDGLDYMEIHSKILKEIRSICEK